MTLEEESKLCRPAFRSVSGGAEPAQKKKHQPRAFCVRSVLPPCTLRGSNPGHPVRKSSCHIVLQSVIRCYPAPRIIRKSADGSDLITRN